MQTPVQGRGLVDCLVNMRVAQNWCLVFRASSHYGRALLFTYQRVYDWIIEVDLLMSYVKGVWTFGWVRVIQSISWCEDIFDHLPWSEYCFSFLSWCKHIALKKMHWFNWKLLKVATLDGSCGVINRLETFGVRLRVDGIPNRVMLSNYWVVLLRHRDTFLIQLRNLFDELFRFKASSSIIVKGISLLTADNSSSAWHLNLFPWYILGCGASIEVDWAFLSWCCHNGSGRRGVSRKNAVRHGGNP